MRLIDADALKRKINERYHDPFFDVCINNAPTISPDSLVKRGRWEMSVESKLDAHTGEYWEEEYYNCLECDYASDWKSPYCPNCGAMMED